MHLWIGAITQLTHPHANALGLPLVTLAIAIVALSLPRSGKLARYVGTPWEDPIVLATVCILAVGIMLTIFGTPHFLKG